MRKRPSFCIHILYNNIIVQTANEMRSRWTWANINDRIYIFFYGILVCNYILLFICIQTLKFTESGLVEWQQLVP